MSLYSVNALTAELHDRGWRLTPNRRHLLHIFQTLPQGQHLNAEQVHDLLQHQGKPCSLGAVYRNLQMLAQLGIFRELNFADGCKRYELNAPAPDHHHHLVCLQCRKILEFKDKSVLKIGLQQAAKAEFHLLDCQFTLFVSCPTALQQGWPASVPPDWTCREYNPRSYPSEHKRGI